MARRLAVVRRVTEDVRHNLGSTASGNVYSPFSQAAMVSVVARGSGHA